MSNDVAPPLGVERLVGPIVPFYDRDGITIYNADCRDVLATLADSSIDLIVTDPPYFKVKGDDWDWQWDKPEHFLAWMGTLCDEWQRVLKPNGSLYVFASPQMAWGVEGEVRKRFNVLNRITWAKPEQPHAERYGPENFRQFVPMSEQIIFAEHFGADNIAKGEAVISRNVPASREGSGVLRCGSGGKVSLSCPEHAGLLGLACMELCDAHADEVLSRIQCICDNRDPSPAADFVSNGLRDALETICGSSDCECQQSSGSAKQRSTRIRKTARVIATWLPSWEPEQVERCIERTSRLDLFSWQRRDNDASNTSSACLAARRWLGNPTHTEGTSWFSVSCDCSPLSASIAHLAAKPSGENQYIKASDELRGFVFEPLRAYLDGERERAGFSRGDVDAAWQQKRGSKGVMTPHWFGVSQFNPPTADAYRFLRELFGAEFLLREYEDLRREYEDLRREYEDLRRPFNVTADVPYTDVWDFPTVRAYEGKHPCQKPIEMLRHIVTASSKPGALVLDCFAGSGVVGEAARNCGRRSILCEIDAGWCERIKNMLRQGRLFADAG